MIKRLIIGTAAVLTGLLAFASSPVSAHGDDFQEAVHQEIQSQRDGWAATALLHGHTYDCFGMAGYNSACVDPTTGYGPVLWLCTGTNCSWSTGIGGAAFYPTFDAGTDFNTPFSRYAWNASAEFYTSSTNIGVLGSIDTDASCNSGCGYAFMPQSTFNSVIWISNSSNITGLHFVH